MVSGILFPAHLRGFPLPLEGKKLFLTLQIRDHFLLIMGSVEQKNRQRDRDFGVTSTFFLWLIPTFATEVTEKNTRHVTKVVIFYVLNHSNL
jgi:hypothetical protein